MRLWLRNAMAAVVVLAASFVLLLYHMKRRYVYLGTALDPTEHPQTLPRDTHYRRVPIAVGGAEIAVYHHTIDPAKPTLLFCHGNHACVELEWSLFERARPHCNLVAWDYRGYGRSSGVPDEANNDCDLLHVLAWVKQELGLDPREIVLWGRSLGTNVVLRFVGHPERQSFLPRRLILLTPFARLSDVLRTFGFPAPALAHLVGNMDVAECLRRYCEHAPAERRVLIAASRHDRVTPWDNAVELRDVAPRQCRLVDLGGTHLDEFSDWALISDFLFSRATADDDGHDRRAWREAAGHGDGDAKRTHAGDSPRAGDARPARHSPAHRCGDAAPQAPAQLCTSKD